MTLNEFAVRIREIGQFVVTATDKNVGEMAGLILTGVVTSTPVDTGRARGNWVVSVGTPATNESKTLDKTGRGTIGRGQRIIATRNPGSTIFLCNNVPYIGRLNDGYSAQAPAGFVEAQIQAAILFIRNRRVLP